MKSIFYKNLGHPFTFFGILIFSLLNIPSIKLFTGPGQILNIIILLLLIFVYIIRLQKNRNLEFTQPEVIISVLLILVIIFTIIPEAVGIRNQAGQFEYELTGLLYGAVVTLVLLFGTKKEDVRTFVLTQIGWGIVITSLYITEILSYYNYNHVSTPIALSILSLFFVVYEKKGPVTTRLFISSIIFIQLTSLLTLGGRSPFVGIPMSICIVVLISSANTTERSITRSLLQIVSVLSGIVILLILLVKLTPISVSSLISERIIRIIISPRSEPRVELYSLTIDWIVQNPFGYGLGSYEKVTGISHPDNLFLHFYFIGGWVVGFLVTLCLFIGIRDSVINCLSSKSIYSMSALSIMFYLVIILSLSARVTDMYIVFGSVAVCVGCLYTTRQNTQSG